MVLKILIIGCGPTALGATYRIRELIDVGEISADDVQVVVLEKENVAGGLSRTITDEMGFSWDLGCHIIAPSKYDCYTRCLEEAVEEWTFKQRNSQADMRHVFEACKDEVGCEESTYVPYPVQQAIPLFPPSIRDQCTVDLKKIAKMKFENPPENFAEWTWRAFGSTMQRIFVRPYNKKVWTVDLEEMNSNWVGQRVATVDLKRLEELSQIDRAKLRNVDLSWGPNAEFRYPKSVKGVGEMWQMVCEKQPSDWFFFNEAAVNICPDEKQVTTQNTVTNEKTVWNYDILISTCPITLLCKMSGLTDKLDLVYTKTILIGFGLRKPQTDFGKTMSWVYFPSEDVIFYRCASLSNFNDKMTPDPDKYWSVLCEVGYKPHKLVDKEDIIQRCIQGLISRDVIESAEQIVNTFFAVLDYGYPVPTVKRDSELKRAHNILESRSIYSRGRFGGWKYEVANQDHSFFLGYELVNRLILGQEETIYHRGPR